jgi:putative glutamine amidotransferase
VAIPTYHLAAGRVLGWIRGGYAVPEGYVAALDRAGGRPVLLPPADGPPPGELLSAFDALLLAGGGDVEPARYGAPSHPEVYGVDPVRDEAELALVRAAIDMGLPTLAVCRGLQVLNVALGGTLHQHLPELEGKDLHGHPRADASVVHEVKVAGGTRLAEACGSDVLRCTSHHHQAVDRLGEGLAVVALSGDGLIEAVEPAQPDAPWLVAVQWHPEITAGQDPFQQALFDDFVAQAAAARPA